MRGRLLVVVPLTLSTLAPGAGAATLPERGQVTSSFTIPDTADQAGSLGRDIDGDGHKDNQLGAFFATMSQQGFDLGTPQDDAIASGDVVLLHSLRTRSLADARTATWQVLSGVPTPEPDLDGGGTFEVSTDLPRSTKLEARIKDHKVRTVAGRIPVLVDLGVESGLGPMELWLKKGVVTATCRRSGCEKGRITGAVPQAQVDDVLLLHFAALMTQIIQRDCPGSEPSSCMADSEGQTIQDIFDADDDMVVTAQELQENELMQALLALDLDLVKANGNPGQDGVPDALSFGVGFTTAPATLSR